MSEKVQSDIEKFKAKGSLGRLKPGQSDVVPPPVPVAGSRAANSYIEELRRLNNQK